MKKTLTVIAALVLYTYDAFAIFNICESPCALGTISSACNNTCINCIETSETPISIYGIITVTNRDLNWDCPSTSSGSINCTCVLLSTTYKCGPGYYGTAINATTGCTACPTNATCGGGNNSVFTCATGYYRSGNNCNKCPDNGTSEAGCTSVQQCYLTAGTIGSDSSGIFKYISDCYYSN